MDERERTDLAVAEAIAGQRCSGAPSPSGPGTDIPRADRVYAPRRPNICPHPLDVSAADLQPGGGV
jgi:hypothetical protein